jgi:UPF0271 protein
MTIDINCDLGESYGEYKIGNDEAVMPFITSANIACGFHAGDPLTICNTILLAIRNNVGVGAHPGYPDLVGFGRRSMKLSKEELRASILYQVGAIKSITETLGGKLHHVKLHGALYNEASSDFQTAMIVARAVKDIDGSLILFGMAGSEMIRAAVEVCIDCASEFFADRSYNDDGTLVSRKHEDAVIHDTNQVVDRVVRMIKQNVVETITGKTIQIKAETVCIHGDNRMAPEFVKNLVSAFMEDGIRLMQAGKK